MRVHTIVLIWTAFSAIGCQERQAALPLGPGIFETAGPGAARIVLFDPCADFSDPDKLLEELVGMINAERARQRLRPVRVDSTLMQLADFYACRLVDGGFFSHVDPFDGSTMDTRAADFGYAFLKIGENLAYGQRTLGQVMSDWMNSPSHRDNILDPDFTEIGVAVKTGGDQGPYWVQEFGRPITDRSTPTAASRLPAADALEIAPSEFPASQPTPDPP